MPASARGFFPVMLGLLWLPFFRAVGWRWFRFLMAVTIGLLLFLVVECRGSWRA